MDPIEEIIWNNYEEVADALRKHNHTKQRESELFILSQPMLCCIANLAMGYKLNKKKYNFELVKTTIFGKKTHWYLQSDEKIVDVAYGQLSGRPNDLLIIDKEDAQGIYENEILERKEI